MNEIIDYDIVFEEYSSQLKNTIKQLMKQGWHPIGGMTQTNNGMYSQTMVKYKD